MCEFLVEMYVSRSDSASGLPRPEDISAAAEQLTREGTEVRLVHTILVPEDETCFYLFQAQGGEAVLAAAARAGIRFGRVVEAVADWGPHPALHE
jgi:hypothetical protein